jgi:predicted DNA-binding protein
MTSPVAIRLNQATRQRIARIARMTRKTASQVMRDALDTGLQKQEQTPRPPYELMAGSIGVVHSGDSRGSSDMGRKLRELLKKRRSRA